MKLIDLYYGWIKTGKIKDRKNSCGEGGLCNAIPIRYRLTLDELIRPDDQDYVLYWGHEKYTYGGEIDKDIQYSFTPLRQTIVLLICAIHNEI